MTSAAAADAESFIIDYIASHADERGEVASREVIAAAEAADIAEAMVVKTRHKCRDRVGSRKGGRREGWRWYLLFDPETPLEDSNAPAAEPESSNSLFRLYPAERLVAIGRCRECSWHIATQGHHPECPVTEAGAA